MILSVFDLSSGEYRWTIQPLTREFELERERERQINVLPFARVFNTLRFFKFEILFCSLDRTLAICDSFSCGRSQFVSWAHVEGLLLFPGAVIGPLGVRTL